MNRTAGDIAEVSTRFYVFADDEGFELKSGGRLRPVTLAYETYGELSDQRDNAVLVFHALTGSQHAAGLNRSVPEAGRLWTDDMHVGWWDLFIGPGRALDTDRLFVVCANYLGGCYGSTGPTSPGPDGRSWGPSFPRVGFADIVRSQIALLEHLGVDELRGVIGASTGGLAALSLATLYPERVRRVVLIGTGLDVTPLQRVHNFEQILAVENDPHFAAGRYDDERSPDRGMALARMIAHKTFISLDSMTRRSRREVKRTEDEGGWYTLNDPLESYMLHQGRKFARRFDANSYLRILDAWNRFDLLEDGRCESFEKLFVRCRDQHFLVFSIDSDACYYPDEQDGLVRVLAAAGVPHRRVTVHSEKGHDSFLLEPDLYAPYLSWEL